MDDPKRSARDVAARPIGIFDSGIGGLTVARAVADSLPHESILYFGDTARCPYGPRPTQEVAGFVDGITDWLVRQNVKLIVIACNTATAAGLERSQRRLHIPVIGVIDPGARAAVQTTTTRRVGVIGTQGTIASGAYDDAIAARDAGITTFSRATPEFVTLVEEGLQASDSGTIGSWGRFGDAAREHLGLLAQEDIDTLVLACTHFPLVSHLIAETMGPGVEIISSAEETARDVREALERRGWLAPEDQDVTHRFATTADDVDEFSRVGERVFGRPISGIDHVEL